MPNRLLKIEEQRKEKRGRKNQLGTLERRRFRENWKIRRFPV